LVKLQLYGTGDVDVLASSSKTSHHGYNTFTSDSAHRNPAGERAHLLPLLSRQRRTSAELELDSVAVQSSISTDGTVIRGSRKRKREGMVCLLPNLDQLGCEECDGGGTRMPC